MVLSLCLLVVAATREASAQAGADEEFFEKQIRPLLAEHCQSCHGDKKQEGGLRLTSRQSLLKGGGTGRAIVPGKPEESLLIKAAGYLDEPKMPPKKKLPDADIAKLKRWVAMGAPWPESNAPPSAAQVTLKHQSWWAYQPVKDRTPPAVKNGSWPRNEIDRFIAAELETHGMQASPPTDRRTWLRRATFDLTGLPPAPEELDAFLADESDQAFERVVDRLLNSPTYGQRWARHWLDVVRYADYHDGDPKARDATCEPLQAWRYRDWVVDSFNRDLPFDQFIVHQIAGDLLPSPEGKEFYANGLIATTFLSNGAWDRGDADKEKMVSDMVDDNIDTIGKAFMGLTLGCARCHDHKFDPISHHDYYALAGVFYSTRILKELGTKGGNYTLNRVPLAEKSYVAKRDEQVRLLNEAKGKLAELDKKTPKPPENDPERLALVAQRDKWQSELLPEPPLAEAAAEGGMPGGLFPGIQDVPIHIRGSYTRLGPVVPRRMPAFFAGEKQPTIASGSGRREVAGWVASKENPLTARVIVNRVWQSHFGAGLVRTPNNFGLLSEPPSHPALLDWLAARFVEDGWSLKKLHRRIMLSATYGQASGRGGERERGRQEGDPENRWLGRFTARRLEAEAIRDAMLFVSGKLDPSTGGPASDDLAISRRSLYVQTARWDRSSFATLFDTANPDASDEKRNVSTVAPQSLFLLNNSFTLAQAKHLADRLIRDVPSDTPNVETSRIQHAYRLLFGRSPSEEEIAIARQLVAQASAGAGWSDLAHVLFCSNEFVYVD
ncbi:MAG: PSD1 domain-containing protein [Planctomycetaceae bacterium]|nr:PSD1 domain-containing protein [Planctomycetaceae bacterium]